MQLLQAHKVARQVAKRACYKQISSNAIATQVAKKLHRVTLAVELDCTSCNDYRDFFKPLQVTARDCNLQHVCCNLQWIFFLAL